MKTAEATGSPTKTVKVTFRIVEYHTIEREVDAEELKQHHIHGDTASYLEDLFINDAMMGSDISTESIHIDNWEVLSENNRTPNNVKRL